ncbi:hypothetical protein OG946_11910 [Streptomyces sp. NBC_01808]|uniref:hypothetical protein n=1 Tax=Streptomyces sp. NBC_01808 TaxID=2975947 RepID=UPI002DDB44E4|nr:hypothetical protein [Streptomyces sp. NBC_01808]WSA38022.1 hypothetical protein OG946_11910 [Streptomyces sp. NBC_01808]
MAKKIPDEDLLNALRALPEGEIPSSTSKSEGEQFNLGKKIENLHIKGTSTEPSDALKEEFSKRHLKFEYDEEKKRWLLTTTQTRSIDWAGILNSRRERDLPRLKKKTNTQDRLREAGGNVHDPAVVEHRLSNFLKNVRNRGLQEVPPELGEALERHGYAPDGQGRWKPGGQVSSAGSSAAYQANNPPRQAPYDPIDARPEPPASVPQGGTDQGTMATAADYAQAGAVLQQAAPQSAAYRSGAGDEAARVSAITRGLDTTSLTAPTSASGSYGSFPDAPADAWFGYGEDARHAKRPYHPSAATKSRTVNPADLVAGPYNSPPAQPLQPTDYSHYLAQNPVDQNYARSLPSGTSGQRQSAGYATAAASSSAPQDQQSQSTTNKRKR